MILVDDVEEKVDELPKGFFLEECRMGHNRGVCLCYNGHDFKSLIHEDTEADPKRACLVSWNLELLPRGGLDEIVRKINKRVKETKQKLQQAPET